ncbi:MAG: ABC transporter substrate-binding protein [bacterium]|nr:ABC transporter substrate-binding protein [bacterium]
MKTKFRYLFALVATFALVAAACGGSSEPPEAGALGQVEIAEGESVQIRSFNAITGDVSFLGIPNQRGVELAIADYGDIQGFSVSMGTGLDDLCSADGGQAGATQIVADPQIIGVIGTSCSGAAGAAMPLISDGGLVMISGSNTSPALTSDLAGNAASDYNSGYYRTAHNDLNQGKAIAQFAYNDLGKRNAGVIHDGDLYTFGLSSAFQTFFEELGGTVSVFTAVNKGDTDMSGVLAEVAAGGPDMIFTPTFPPEVNFIAQQVGNVSGLEGVTMVGADASLVDNFLEIPEAAGWYHSGPDLRYGSNENSITETDAETFLAAYNSTWGEAPSASFWAHSYDAATMLLKAIDDVAVEVDGSLYVDRQKVRDALNDMSLDGIIGPISCDDFGDCGSQLITIILNESPSDIEAANQNVVYEFRP